MARELKIKIKNDAGKFDLKKIEFPEKEKVEKLENQIKNPAFKFPDDENKKVKIVRETREYELITPLFGGGAETKKADEISIIRATEIRGHLRFWWRATRGGQFPTIEELKKHEDAIFGSTEKNSALQIEVELEENYKNRIKQNEELKRTAYSVSNYFKDGEEKFRTHPSEEIAEYAAFPLQPKDEEKRKGWTSEVSVGVKFKIVFSYPKILKITRKDKFGKLIIEKEFEALKEIQSAFWAWETFGGVGARTRRGFGALKLSKHNIDGKSQSIEYFESKEYLLEKAKDFIFDGEPAKGIPYLPTQPKFLIKDFNKDAKETWKNLIETYKDFRQHRKIEIVKDKYSGKEKKMPKRSKWNEPEAIRELTNQRDNKHQKLNHLCFTEPKFPRADFGLPIVTKFKDKYDPKKTNLSLDGFERYSSPLILRPIAGSNGKFLGLALILENEQSLDEIGLVLEEQEGKKRKWTTSKDGLKVGLTEDEARNIKTRDNSGELLDGETDVLQAFLNYLEK